jgi:hypothetical protein
MPMFEKMNLELDIYEHISTDPRYAYKRKHYLKNQAEYKAKRIQHYYENCEEINQKKKEDIVECLVCCIQIRRDSYERHTLSKRHRTLAKLAEP